jgi:small-conductance mechanosensitive channel
VTLGGRGMPFFADFTKWVEVNVSIKHVFWNIIVIILIYIAARITIRITDKMINHMIGAKYRGPIKFDPRRANTIGLLIHNLISYTVNFICVLLILGQLGVNLAPLLAGAGVLGLAIGFGAQSLVKDVITGFFIIFEDQFGVGDVIQIDQFKGTVEEIGIRVTRIKSWTGEVHIIPNGSIKQVTNFSVYNSLAVVDISIAYDADVDKAMQVLKETIARIHADSEQMVKEPELLGVQMIGNSEIKLRIIAECKPNTQGDVARILNAKIKKQFDQHGIEMPYPKTITYVRTERPVE